MCISVHHSTQDAKQVLKTKISSTNLVTLTLTLTKIEYSNRVGGGGNIVPNSVTADRCPGSWVSCCPKQGGHHAQYIGVHAHRHPWCGAEDKSELGKEGGAWDTSSRQALETEETW